MQGSPDRSRISVRQIYVLAVLSLVSLLNFYDRNLISILIEDLKRDLQLSDAQIGILTGLAFTLIYTMVAIPIARFADSGRRVAVLSASLFIWSAMTAVCGLAGSFATLVLARVGVGVGEAGGAPTTHALVAETFGPKWRGTALSIIGATGAAGSILAMFIGGSLATHYGWRHALMISSVPGFLLTALLFCTIREPRTTGEAASAPAISLVEVINVLRRRAAFVWLGLGISVVAVGAYGQQVWTPAYIMRRYHLDAAAVGAGLSFVSLPGAIIGTLAGGVLNDWLSRYDQRWPVWLLMVSFGLATPLQAIRFWTDSYQLMLALTFPLTFISVIWIAPAYALTQSLSGPRLRATGASLLFLVVNLGQGFGPLLVGLFSDALKPASGGHALGSSLLLTCITFPVGVLLFWRVARTVTKDIAEANAV
jgi:MFS family permease